MQVQYNNKTKNGALGVKKDLETKVNSIASWAKEKGCRVGIRRRCGDERVGKFNATHSGRNNHCNSQ